MSYRPQKGNNLIIEGENENHTLVGASIARPHERNNKGITLVALVVTIIVLIILATITVTIVVGENGLINRAQQAKILQEGSLASEELNVILLGYNLSNENRKAKGEEPQTLAQYLAGEDGVSVVKDKANEVVISYKGNQYSVNKSTLATGAYQSQGLPGDKETLVTAKLKNTSTAMTVSYVPTANAGASVVIPSANNGGVADQTFTQSSVGSQNRTWYVLSTDDEGVNLVSTVTAQSVTFKDSAGYDNCLYYLDKISKDLFTNEEQYGVTRDRVHALNLTDIKKATEQMNSGTKVGERDWSWETDFLGSSLLQTYTGKTAFRSPADYTNSNRYYPGIYEDVDGVVNCNNPLYDEEVIANPITDDTGIKARGLAGSKLTVNNTYFYFSNKSDNMTALGKGTAGTFGNSKIGDTLFTGTYWLASRCVYANSNYAYFYLRYVSSGILSNYSLCTSNGYANSRSNPWRVVVSVPGSHVDVDSNGNVTLK